MSVFSRLTWKEGQFLLPQHFQQMERSLEAAFAARWQVRSSIMWGISSLTLDEGALAQGRLELTRCQAILRDGTVVDIPSVDLAPAARPLPNLPPTQVIEVYLGLPVVRTGHPTTSADPRRSDTRFIERSVEVADDLEPSRIEKIEVATKNLRILFGGEPQAAMTTLKIAEIKARPDGLPGLAPGFSPPSVRLASSPALLAQARGLVGAVASRAGGLRHARKERSGQGIEFASSDVESFWYLHTLNTYTHSLRHLVELPATHPAELFQEWVRLLGALSTFDLKNEYVPPLYEHEKMSECFNEVEKQIRHLLTVLFTSRYEPIALRQQQGYWIGELATRETVDRGRFFLGAVATESVSPGELHRLSSYIKIASPDGIEPLVRGAVGGVTIGLVSQRPPALPVPGEAVVYRLQCEGDDWEKIRRSGQIAIHVPAWLKIRLELVAEREVEKR